MSSPCEYCSLSDWTVIPDSARGLKGSLDAIAKDGKGERSWRRIVGMVMVGSDDGGLQQLGG